MDNAANDWARRTPYEARVRNLSAYLYNTASKDALADYERALQEGTAPSTFLEWLLGDLGLRIVDAVSEEAL